MTVSTTAAAPGRTPGVSAGLLLLVLALVAAGNPGHDVQFMHAGGAMATGSVTIGYSAPNQHNEVMRSLGARLQAYAGARGAKVIVGDPAGDATTQVRQLTGWIEDDQVQAIWALPVDAAALVPVLARARAKGVAVLVAGSPQDYGYPNLTAGTSYSFIDHVGYGEDVGRALGECANARLRGRAQVLYLRNPDGMVGGAQFEQGLRRGLAATSPRSGVVSVVDSRLDPGSSRQATVSTLDAGVDAVAGANDDAMVGALRGLSDAGRDPARSCVAGAGGGAQARAAVRSGSIYAVVAWQYEQDLVQSVDQLLQMADDPDAIGMQLLSPIETIRR